MTVQYPKSRPVFIKFKRIIMKDDNSSYSFFENCRRIFNKTPPDPIKYNVIDHYINMNAIADFLPAFRWKTGERSLKYINIKLDEYFGESKNYTRIKLINGDDFFVAHTIAEIEEMINLVPLEVDPSVYTHEEKVLFESLPIEPNTFSYNQVHGEQSTKDENKS